MKKHTKGPWMVNDNGVEDGCLDVWVGTEGDFPVVEDINGEDVGQTRANANLIAAAPELLEMLKVAVGRCEINNCSGEEDEFIEMFDSAIARAQGGH